MQTQALVTAIALSFILDLALASQLLAADVLVGASVPASRRIALEQVDHSVWDGLLKKYVGDSGRVNYKAWKANSGDAQALDQYLAHLSHSNDKGTTEQQLAFWINAYNAVTVKHQIFYISPILQWFGEDFGNTESAQLKTIAPYISDSVASQAAAAGRGSMSFVDYDWGLNDQK